MAPSPPPRDLAGIAADTAPEHGHGLAPLYVADMGNELRDIEDALLFGAVRMLRAELERRGNWPGAHAIDEAIPLVIEGYLALRRMRRDGLADVDTGPGQFVVSTRGPL